MHPHMPLENYQRLHRLAKLHALELRQQAIRDAHAWVACALVHAVRRLARLLRLGRPQAVPPRLSHFHAPTLCQPLY